MVALPAHEREQIDSDLRLQDALAGEVELAERAARCRSARTAGGAQADDDPGRRPRDGALADRCRRRPGPLRERRASSSATSASTRASASPVTAPSVPAISRGRDRRTRAGCWSRRRTARSAPPARCGPSTRGSRPAAAARSRSARPLASSPSSPGTCSPKTRTTATPPPTITQRKLRTAPGEGRRQRPARSASPARPPGRRSSGGCSKRPSATTEHTSSREQAARVPSLGKRLSLALEGQTMRGRPTVPEACSSRRGHPRHPRSYRWTLDFFIRIRGLDTS